VTVALARAAELGSAEVPSEEARVEKRRPVTTRFIERFYRRPPSFTDLLPWFEYVPEGECFVLEDGVSVGALFEVEPVATEARSEGFLAELRDGIEAALTDALPELETDPWCLQLYVQDEPSLKALLRERARYRKTEARGSAFTRHFEVTFASHLARLCRPGGLFLDTAVTGCRFRGNRRRVRAVLYRRLTAEGQLPDALAVEAELDDVAAKWVAALASAGIAARRGTGRDLYEWLLPWFNPRPEVTGGDPERLLELAPYPGDDALPFGPGFAELLTLSMPYSDKASGTWWFDGCPQTVVTVQALRRPPVIGHLTAERLSGERVAALFDRLPEGTVLVMTMTVRPQDLTRAHIGRVRQAAVGHSAEAALTREEAEAAEREMARGHKLYPLEIAFYVRGEDLNCLRRNVNQVNALLLPAGLQPLAGEAEQLALDSYIRNLPMAYDPALEDRRRRARLVFARQAASLAPLYGRSRGTGRPGLCFFNRGGEPLLFDPLNREDRKKNAHMLILGPTGAGKSALLVYCLEQMMALYRPRLFIIEAGGSFALLASHFSRQGLSVNEVTLKPSADVSLPPFADALRLLERRRPVLAADPEALAENDEEESEAGLSGRDLLGEMEIAARIMVTGGDEREDARMSRADRFLLRQAILLAARTVQDEGGEQVLTEDVVQALRTLGEDRTFLEHRRHRALEMADGMALFCSGLAAHFFNRPGSPWPEADVTLLEMGTLAREGYEDQLTVAYLSMMSHIHDLVERHQSDARPTLVVTDEGHIITTNPLLARFVVKITKMWRKLGAWFWIATQTLEDFPDASRRMLNMMEWWLCLSMPKEEVEQIARFRELTLEQRRLLLSTRKEPGKYVEGVVLADNLEALFRNVPPALSLALAMTEKHEKAERAALMRERRLSELEAAYIVAERIARAREAE